MPLPPLPPPADEIWNRLLAEARETAGQEPLLAPMLETTILRQPDLGAAVAERVGGKLEGHGLGSQEVRDLLRAAFAKPAVAHALRCDLSAIVDRDPAAGCILTPLLFFKGFHAISAYRAAHELWLDGRRMVARLLQSMISEAFSVDIHPAARIGCGILLDHATSFVAGETAVIADHVSILHEVTLGGTGKEHGDRHPIVESHVLLGAGAKILGRVTIGQGAKVGAGSVVLADVPPHTTVVGVPAVVVGETRDSSPADAMDQCI
jgi:serine O-acetyltransferase